MFDNLRDNLGKSLQKLKGKGFLNEADVTSAMREVRVALLEADVALPVVKDFVNKVKEKAVGEEVIKSVSPAQMVIKIVQDALEDMLAGDDAAASELNLRTAPPAVVMMVGLQGSGKTTSCAKISNRVSTKQNKKILMASLDVYRPAAQEQLEMLGKQCQINTVPIIEGEKPAAITKRALKMAKLEGYDVLMLDTAGRLHIDDALMAELQDVKKIANPIETLLVVDALTGQDAVNVAQQFQEKIGVTGVALTRIDGDSRGGAALSMRAVTGCPIKFLGVGEKISELETFHPDRIASRILGMGDVVSLVEKAAETIDKSDADKMAKRMRKGSFNLNDLSAQLGNINKMGGMGSLMGMIPGLGNMQGKLEDAGMDESVIKRQQAMISSMTKKERAKPELINASRKKRIVAGSGVTIQELNQLLKQFKQMQTMMKKFGKMDKKKLMRQMGGMNLKNRPH